ncbi:hypothetical protein [Neobacillus cucumis]|uniref:hypothetical protein n=1 Tax=Neobacillus cucumis TaxID=1740721 RepID=UPI0019649B97|nr:hypothetical protein [Neobacillus cucumis]MBM7654978.1 hypothetical protein [Neobacillus cucumis]MED4226290.1 hypothetical protein [Neobacillus cucumis]
MNKNEKKMKINAEKFAYTVVSSRNVEGDMPEEIAKKQLTLYLSAYWLAEKFNSLETQSFQNMKRKEYEDLMMKLSGYKVF